MALTRHRSWISGSQKKVTGVLDVGSSKIVCLIAALDAEPRTSTPNPNLPSVRILGIGHQQSRGVKGGVITDLDKAEEATRAAIAQAERMAGVMLDEVHLSIACGRLKSHNFVAATDIESGIVTDADFERLLTGGQAYAERTGRTVVHLNEVAVRLDGAAGIHDPRGMAGQKLSADLHAVTADDAPLRNLLLMVERCYLKPASLTAAPFASALAVTTEEERRLGATVIDIGGGTTTLAMFAEDRFIGADAAPLGGHHLTLDIARALHTPLAEAERIKALYGTLARARSDERELFSYPVTGEEDGVSRKMTKAELAEVIRPRIRLIADHVVERLAESPVARYASHSVILTGGTSNLVGLADMMAEALSRPVRVSRPEAATGLPPQVLSPAFATGLGLLLAGTPEQAGRMTFKDQNPAPSGYLERVGSWLKDGF